MDLRQPARHASPAQALAVLGRRRPRKLRHQRVLSHVRTPGGNSHAGNGPCTTVGRRLFVMSRKNRRAAAALKTSEARYRTLFESIDEGFCVIEVLFGGAGAATDYRFLEVNPSFERLTGLRDAVGKRMRELAADHEEHWFRIYGEIATTGQPRRFENRAEALHRWYDVYAFRIGKPQQHRVAILFNDVSERKQAEQVLRDEHRRKDEFLAILAHELRNPLAPLRNGIEILRLARNDPAAVERTRVMMERQVRQMVSLVDDLLDVSRIGRGLISFDPKRVDVADVVRGALETAEPVVRGRGHE